MHTESITDGVIQCTCTSVVYMYNTIQCTTCVTTDTVHVQLTDHSSLLWACLQIGGVCCKRRGHSTDQPLEPDGRGRRKEGEKKGREGRKGGMGRGAVSALYIRILQYIHNAQS